MYRRGGSAAILAGLVLGVLFLFWPLQFQTGWVRTRQDVTKVHVTCGTPYPILFDAEFSDEVRTPWIQSQCVRAARTRLLNVALVSLPLLVLGTAAVARGRYRRVPLNQMLRPLPRLREPTDAPGEAVRRRRRG